MSKVEERIRWLEIHHSCNIDDLSDKMKKLEKIVEALSRLAVEMIEMVNKTENKDLAVTMKSLSVCLTNSDVAGTFGHEGDHRLIQKIFSR